MKKILLTVLCIASFLSEGYIAKAYAEEQNISPSISTIIWASTEKSPNAGITAQYNPEATSWNILAVEKREDGSYDNANAGTGGKVMLTKFDLSGIINQNVTITNAKIIITGTSTGTTKKNISLDAISTDWDETIVWGEGGVSINLGAKELFVTSHASKSANLEIDVTNNVKEDKDGILGYALRVSGHNLTVTKFQMKLTYVDASAVNYAYTINYTYDGNIVLSQQGSGSVGSKVNVDNTIESNGINYYSIEDELPFEITNDEIQNIKNVPVRIPYSAQLIVTRKFDGIAEETPTTMSLSETERGQNSYVHVFPYYVQCNDKWYVASLKDGKFGFEGNFFNETISKEIEYSLAENVVAYFDNSKVGTNINYSNGNCSEQSQGKYVTTTLEAGVYQLKAYKESDVKTRILLITNEDLEIYKTNSEINEKDARAALKESALVNSNTKGDIEGGFCLNKETTIHIGNADNTTLKYDYYLISKVDSSPVTSVDKYGYTFSCKYPLDFTDTGIDAYIAEYNGKDVVTLKQVYKVPANTGLIVKGNSGTDIPTTLEETEDVSSNCLVAVSQETSVAQTANGKSNYVLGYKDGEGIGFYLPKADGTTVAKAGTAYLSIDTPNEKPSALRVVSATTAIENIYDNVPQREGLYDLMGRPVKTMIPGTLYIRGGKKVIAQ